MHLPIVGLSIVPLVLGRPMVLMPVHIVFLQLIIDSACSIVFEAEPLASDAMRTPPRRPDARLFDAQVLLGAVQGCGLFGIVLVAYLVARSASGSDETARALAFAVLVVTNLALIHVNRTWTRHRDSFRPWNAAFGWIASATCALLVLVLWVPAVSGLLEHIELRPLTLRRSEQCRPQPRH